MIRFLALLCVLVLPTAPSLGQEIFSDDFESGSLDSWSNAVGAVLDVDPPSLTLESPSEVVLQAGALPAIVLSYQDEGIGIDQASLRVEVDGSGITTRCTIGPAEASCPMTEIDLGSHTLFASIADRNGNEAMLTFGFEVVSGGGGSRPRIMIVRPGSVVAGDATPEIELAWERADASTLLLTLDEVDITSSCTVDGSSAICEPPALRSGAHTLRAEIRDSGGLPASALVVFQVTLSLEITILEPANGFLTRDDTVTVRGAVAAQATEVVLAGLPATLDGSGGWEVSGVPLKEGANPLSATARTGQGGIGSAVITVVKDTEAPRVVLRAPGAGSVVTQSVVLVTGEVADPTSSSYEAVVPRVTVNGLDAEVEHKSFLVEDFLLQPGANVLVAVAEDAAGNVGRTEITVDYQPNALRKIEEVQGNAQRGVVGETLGQPLIVRLVDRIGNPVSNRPVTFQVVRGDGAVIAYPEAADELTVLSDERGLAQVRFSLGRRSGSGNHEVAATADGFTGQVVFCASAAALLPERIKPVPGNDHTGARTGEAGQPMHRPLYAQVFDGNGNPVPDLLVSWEVVAGGGVLAGGEPIAATRTDAEGRASIEWILGPDATVNGQRVTASFAGLEEPPATFVATAVDAGLEQTTAIVGVVTDNQDEPMPGVTLLIENTDLWAVTSSDGRFRIDGAPVGEVHLLVDGTTTSRPGQWAKLAFEMTTVAGVDNELGMVIRILPMSEDSGSRRIVGGTEDVTLGLEGVPGSELTVWANSVTFPDGSPTGELSVTQVHSDKVPMVPPQGSSFMLAWTIQPPGVKFDPPARIAIPNFGDPPGTVVDIYSFDHDLGEFVSIGTATVSEDGSQLASDPGFGVVKSGWHGCLPPPPPTAETCRTGTCRICVAGSRRTVPKCSECEVCDGGDCIPRRIEAVAAEVRVGQGEWKMGRVSAGRGRNVFFQAEIEGRCGPGTVYEWSFDDGSSGEGRSVTHAFEEEGLYRVRVLARCDGCLAAGSATDDVLVRVGLLDLTMQDLPEEDDVEPNEESPGGFVVVNNNDTNGNHQSDLLDETAASDVDLIEVAINLDEEQEEGELSLGVTEGSERIAVYADSNKAPLESMTWRLDSEDPPSRIFVEGLVASSAPGDVELAVTLQVDGEIQAEDRVVITVGSVDLAVDSNNDGVLDEGDEEAELAAPGPDKPGMLLVVNSNDTDDDRIVDFADGFNRDGSPGNEDDILAGEIFPTATLTVSEGVDLSRARLRLTYNASAPSGISLEEDLGGLTRFVPPSEGSLRIWARPAAEARLASEIGDGGHLIGSNEYALSAVLGGGRKVELHLEGVGPSTSAGADSILVEVDPDGDGPLGYLLSDEVRLTSLEFCIFDEAVLFTQVRGGEVAWIKPEPEMPQLVARVVPPLDLGAPLSWVGEVRHERIVVNLPPRTDITALPRDGSTHDISSAVPWVIHEEFAEGLDGFVGGNAKIRVVGGPGLEHEITFRILGLNPEDLVFRNEITVRAPATASEWAYTIPRHENRQGGNLYNQFDNRREKLGYPIQGGDGFGVMQVDLSASGDHVPTAALWNWVRNLEMGVEILKEKNDASNRFMNNVLPRGGVCGPAAFPDGQRPQSQVDSGGGIYVWDPNGDGSCDDAEVRGGAAVAIADKTVSNCTFVDGADLEATDGGAMKRYNGASRPPGNATLVAEGCPVTPEDQCAISGQWIAWDNDGDTWAYCETNSGFTDGDGDYNCPFNYVARVCSEYGETP